MVQKITVALAILACNVQMAKAQTPSFKQLPNGLEYSIVKDEPGKNFIADGSYVSMHIRTKIADSAMFDSYKMNNEQPIEQQLTKQFLGGFMEGFQFLTAGDSAILRMPIDSAFQGGQLPPFAKSGDKVTYTVKILSVKSKEEFEASKLEAASKQIKMDDEIIQNYIKKNNLKDVKKTESGLYYMIEKAGNGKHATAADKVKVHYSGFLLDGTKFDSSLDRGEPIEFPLTQVIKGWTEGIPLLEEGGKGKLLIPSGLAYGQNAPPGSPIKANDVLIFDVELIQITKP
ncbi:MAG: FKBP-type peptidyl-prolyl cis-trans isomerase [Bacteroidetes bacterium]|nr:FKBP-type peptidyl-prolyl cis-trans isomerase [Bacteroidota bacterium]